MSVTLTVAVYCVQLLDTEMELDETQDEISSLRTRLSDIKDDQQVKECSYYMALEEARQTENQLTDDQRLLQQSLDEAGTQLKETRLELGVAESRVSALESQLTQVDACRLDAETKLASIVSSLKRFVGLRHGVKLRARSVSPRPRHNTPEQANDTGTSVCLSVCLSHGTSPKTCKDMSQFSTNLHHTADNMS